jgi:ligand-binding sensor domain-containing protein/serine phosphatase RsbU (regulator of sigma subunit)
MYFKHLNVTFLLVITNFFWSCLSFQAQKITSTNFEVQNGLLNPSVTQIYQSKNEDIWLTSFGGVTRYNGRTFRHYGSKDGLKSELIRSICETSEGSLFVATMEDGIYKFDGIKFKRIFKKLPEELFFINADSHDGIYVASEKGLFYVDSLGKIENISKTYNLKQSYVTNVSIDKKGVVWFNYDQQFGIYSFNPKTKKIKRYSIKSNDPSIRIIGTYHDRDGKVWLTSSEGLFVLSKSIFNKINIPLLPNYYLFDFTDIGNNLCLIGSQTDGLILFDKKQLKVLKKINVKNGLLNSLVFRIFVDHEQNIWTSCWGKGISRLQLNGLYHFTTDFFKDVYALSSFNNKLYLATNSGIFVKDENEFNKIVTANSEAVFSFIIDNKELLYATEKQLKCLNIETRKNINIKGAAVPNVRSITKRNDQEIYITTWGHGVYKYDGNEIQKVNLQLLQDVSFYYCSYVDNLGNLYLGTWDAGVLIYDGKKWKQISKKNGLTSNKISAITSDNNGNIYLGTNGSGIMVLSKELKIKSIYNDHFLLKNNTINSLNFEKGILWIGSIECVSKFNTLTEEIFHYDNNQGFRGSNLLLSVGKVNNSIFFGTTKGLWEINEGFLLKNKLNLNPILDEVLVNKNRIRGKNQFSYLENNFNLKFHSPQQIGSELIVYSYEIKGPDGTFSDETKNKSIQLLGLQPGNYSIVINSLYGKDKSKIPITYSFIIKPPFWRTIVFQSFFVLLIILLVIFFYKQKTRSLKRKKEELEAIVEARTKELKDEKELVEHKNREILDSITYAKRIQSAILPQPKLVKEFLEDSFVLYKPKDIVAGDFYWLEVVEDTVLFAAADCTGHGVPGAMVSVVCNNGLNRAVREFKLTKPNEILDKTRELVIQEFAKSDEDVKDGMDISLCALDTKSNVLNWSGANNPLWILRKNSEGLVEVLETKPDKQPIGKHSGSKPFTLFEKRLQKNDIIYIFTDGYQDQFGGPKEKKYRVSQMREFFMSIFEQPMEEQRKLIDASFESWKGDLEQVDDVCVIGVRI